MYSRQVWRVCRQVVHLILHVASYHIFLDSILKSYNITRLEGDRVCSLKYLLWYSFVLKVIFHAIGKNLHMRVPCEFYFFD